MVEIVVEILVGINLIRSGLYGEDRGEIYFIILKLIKSIFKLLGKYKKKYYGDDMAINVVQCERSNIKYYSSIFSNI